MAIVDGRRRRIRRARAHADADLSWCGGGAPNAQIARPQQSSSLASSVQSPLRSIRLRVRPSAAWAASTKSQRKATEAMRRRPVIGLTSGDDEQPSVVVGAVSVLVSAARCRRRVRTGRARRSAARGGRSSSSCSTGSYRHRRRHAARARRQARRTAGRPSPSSTMGPVAGPRRAIDASSARSVSAGPDRCRRTLAGRRGARRCPAPAPSSSTACGNAVAITGRPAAIASTNTPEVT